MKKFMIVGATILVVGVGVAGLKLYLSFNEALQTPGTTTSVVTQDQGPAKSPVDDTHQSGFESASDDLLENYESDFWDQELTENQLEEIRQWNTQHGYFNYYRDYGRLSEAGLVQLSQTGDIGAFHALAARHALDNPRQSIEHYKAAATNGSTYALLLIGELYMFHAGDGGLLDEAGDQNSARVQALAHSFAAQLLGDNAAAGRQSEKLLGTPDSKSILSSENLKAACESARNIVDEIAAARVLAGQAPVNNAPAPYTRGVKSHSAAQEICGNG